MQFTEEMRQGIKEDLYQDDIIITLADIFKALSEPTRLEIIYCLNHKPMYVEEIAEAVGKSQSSISHQLRFLRNLRLVKYEKEGRRSIYQLDDEHVKELFCQGLEHAKHKHQ